MANWLLGDEELMERERIRENGREAFPYTRDWVRANAKKIYCYGAGVTLLFVAPLLSDTGIAGVVDSDSRLWNREKFGFAVLPPESLLAGKDDSIVVITANTPGAIKGIADWCRENDVHCVDWFDYVRWSDGAVWDTDIECDPETIKAAELWEDDLSRATYAALLKNYAAFSPAAFPAPVPNQYFQDIVPRRFYRNFVDAGACRGDTLEAFRKWVGDDFDSYTAIEALASNADYIRKNVSDPRVRVIHAAIGDRQGTVRMQAMRVPDEECNGIAKMADADATEGAEVALAALDSFPPDSPPGLIKMDIEGAEPEALRGAEATIRRYAPALVISVYHAPEHLWQIPAWIARSGPEYKFYLRHHSVRWHETVCYAVPK